VGPFVVQRRFLRSEFSPLPPQPPYHPQGGLVGSDALWQKPPGGSSVSVYSIIKHIGTGQNKNGDYNIFGVVLDDMWGDVGRGL